MFRDDAFHQNSALEISRLKKRVARLKRLAAKYKRAEATQNTLLEISNIANKATSMEGFYQGMHLCLKQLIPADNFYISLLDAQKQHLELPFFSDEKDSHPSELYPGQELSQLLTQGLTGYVLRTATPLLCDEHKAKQLADAGEIIALGSSCHQWLGVPIIQNDRAIGVLVVQSYNPASSYGEMEFELMAFISHHIAGVMERLRHHEQLEQAISQRTQELSQAYGRLKQEVYERRRAERLQKSLFEITELSSSNLDDREFYTELHRVLCHLLPANNCYIALLDETATELHFPFYVSQLNDTAPKCRPLMDGLVEYLLRLKRPVLLDQSDIQSLVCTKEIYSKAPDLNQTQNMHQWIGVPLFIQDKIAGALTIYSFSMHQNYQFKDLELLTFVSQHIATAIERKLATEALKRSNEALEEKILERTRELATTNQELQKEISQRRKAEQQLLHDAKHDALTGLPNRLMFMERLNQAVKHNRRHLQDKFALLFVDLDRFKLINDTLGHLEGDRFLVETASRLKFCIRDNDTLARLGGDEFVILLDGLRTTDDAKEVAERILKELSRPYELADKQFNSGASIGIAVSGHHKDDTSESILRDADTAMYMAKTRGKGCYVVFDEKSHQQLMQDVSLENELRTALDTQQIQLDYFPVQDLKTGQLQALDVRLYWPHPQHGKIKQQQLANLADQANLQLELDRYAIEALNSELPKLQLNSGTKLHLAICSQHLKHKHALRSLKNCLRNCQFPLTDLCLFFHEQSLSRDLENHINGFEVLKRLQVTLGITGYGSGYSPLISLSFLPVNVLRLDASLVSHLQSPHHRRLLKAINLSAGALELELVLDGINTQEQKQQLAQMGFNSGQGQALGNRLNPVSSKGNSTKPIDTATQVCA
ncbi:diguanylate cyclase domain-containing protein [Shewanella indica]|uniref:sensor domain-containing phosphodiesterase n=1 Tax=Shewanella indica TaxID=768528 RepID=UPI000C33CCF5|nr:diguanylate cyclase [Shewanella indica]GHB19780.1 bifunctional diguanylate cyclase/phosphodiesterase [Shewanella indica]